MCVCVYVTRACAASGCASSIVKLVVIDVATPAAVTRTNEQCHFIRSGKLVSISNCHSILGANFSLFSGRRFARHPCRLFSMLSTEQHLGWPFPIAIICFFIRFRVRHIMICLFFFHSIVCVVARQTQITDAGTHTTRPLSTWWICLALSVYLSHHHIIAIWEMLMTHAIAVPGDQHSTAGWFECENTWRSQIIRQWWWQTHNVYLFVVVHSWLNCV